MLKFSHGISVNEPHDSVIVLSPQAVDAVYFNGSNRDGVFLVAATARRHQGLVQTLLYVRVSLWIMWGSFLLTRINFNPSIDR